MPHASKWFPYVVQPRPLNKTNLNACYNQQSKLSSDLKTFSEHLKAFRTRVKARRGGVWLNELRVASYSFGINNIAVEMIYHSKIMKPMPQVWNLGGW